MLWRSFLEYKCGIRLLISGKWFGKMRAKKKIFLFGLNKRQTINMFVDYHNTQVITKYGIFSIKL
jgi:ribosomal protein S3